MHVSPCRSSAAAKSAACAACLAVILSLCQPRSVRAEDNLTYKLSSYTEDDERIKVTSHCAFTEFDLGQDRSLEFMRVGGAGGGCN
jgi:hypothetical protein